ncbi:AAL175Wp [Eremothecium gossypii ATCC 10895]|uniref:AAL175Wp n=1 Tax=Eremothecium gossypii (strain ATCC 10895 / CBS 109.51 / FGSC 9923 / NRRL Y-1056) TaxID=284811 RepID=Q75F91_EREGS|nr:AAL175Wp [Eremothecium gossypii ATCC 10895]AAS50191.1 AAL175Wp [Eremothecium gossypii ATCC 10895]AEY94476.1 FAAL175Wp [Eremothecium gossypii FDAG1]
MIKDEKDTASARCTPAARNDEALQKKEGSGTAVRRPRAKTFTGCWTCRLRKVKCDLGKPSCQRCEKSGLDCGGYDIKLRWSNPIRFDKFGNQMAGEDRDGDGEQPAQPFQRRNIMFVRYDEEYEYYEDMDDELSALHSPPLEMIADHKTWIIKRFGVFKGTDRVKRKYVPRKRRKVNPVFADAMAREHRRKLEEREKQARRKRKGELQGSLGSGNATGAGFAKAGPPAAESAGAMSPVSATPLFDFDFSTPGLVSSEWMAGELKDDTTLSSAMLRNTLSFPTGLSVAQHGDGITADTAPPKSQSSIFPEQTLPLQSAGTMVPPSVDEVSKVYRLLLNNQGTDCNSSTGYKGLSGVHTPYTVDNVAIHGPESRMPASAIESVPSIVPDPTIFTLAEHTNSLIRLPRMGMQIHGLTRFLLSYYQQNVADLMSVVALPKNPWKTIYFPRAVKALGELGALGYTSHSRNALLNALLAVSCFHLQSKFPKNSKEMKYFVSLGMDFRNQASGFLNACLSSTSRQEHYKDVLTAILSMNSIDVVWGTMSDCQYHLTICEEFIESRMKSRPLLSEKARCLHRIFSFLKLIQDSTALDKVQEKEIIMKDAGDKEFQKNGSSTPPLSTDSSSFTGRYVEQLNKDNGRVCIEFIEKDGQYFDTRGSVPLFNTIVTKSYPHEINETRIDTLSMDVLYGLPNSLILLFSDCVSLVRHRFYFKRHNTAQPTSFGLFCVKIEQRLLSWKPEWIFWKDDSKAEFINDTVEGVYHHTMSFYYGLLIYYFTMARSLEDHTLQNYVQKVLSHLRELGNIIEHKDVKIVPLMWQGFMAGCSCTDSSMQLEFKKWTAQLVNFGIGSYWGARQIMLEVWRRRMTDGKCDNWYSVYCDWEMNLMLA